LELMYTVNPGIEDIAADEISRELGGSISYELMSGHVYHVVENVDYEAFYRLRSINKVFTLIWKGIIGKGIEDLVLFSKSLSQILRERRIWEYVTPHTSFAVETERIGEHKFTSIDISRIIGELVIKVVEEVTGKKPKVNLRTPNTIVHAFVRQDKVFVGISLSGSRSLHRRGYRLYDHPAALKPTLAYAMLTLSGTRDKDLIVDPMCGGGTIPIEAAYIHEDSNIYCLDVNKRYVEVAEKNAFAAGVVYKITFDQWDARRIHEYNFPSNIDRVVSNPPYGIRYGDPRVIRRLYSSFLESLYKVLSDNGRVTLITTEYTFLNRLIEKLGYIKIHERIVQHGGLYPHIVVFTKK